MESLQGSEERISRVRADLIPGAMRAAAADLQPTPPQVIAIECAKLADWARAFNVPAKDFEIAAKAYGESLGYLPKDLIIEAFAAVRATHKWGMRLPLPAEIAVHVREKLEERRRVQAKLLVASRCPVEDDPGAKRYEDMTEAERAAFNDALDKLRGRGKWAHDDDELPDMRTEPPGAIPNYVSTPHPSPGVKRQAEAAALIAARIHRDAGHPLTPSERQALERAGEPTERHEAP